MKKLTKKLLRRGLVSLLALAMLTPAGSVAGGHHARVSARRVRRQADPWFMNKQDLRKYHTILASVRYTKNARVSGPRAVLIYIGNNIKHLKMQHQLVNLPHGTKVTELGPNPHTTAVMNFNNHKFYIAGINQFKALPQTNVPQVLDGSWRHGSQRVQFASHAVTLVRGRHRTKLTRVRHVLAIGRNCKMSGRVGRKAQTWRVYVNTPQSIRLTVGRRSANFTRK